MAIPRTLLKVGLARKIYDEARKPENQARIKGAIASVKRSKPPGADARGPEARRLPAGRRHKAMATEVSSRAAT